MNGPLDLLWSTSQILLNNTPVNSSTDFHYIKSSIVKLVTLSGDERRSQHACGYVYEGTIDRLRNNIFGIFGPPPPPIHMHIFSTNIKQKLAFSPLQVHHT